MKIHRYEKVWIAVSLALIVGFIATVAYGAVGAGVEMVADDGGTIDPNNIGETPFADPGVRKVGSDRYEVYVVAQQFLFRPGTSKPIRVPAHSTVTFHVTSTDVVHGFQVVGTNLNLMVIPGQVTTATVHFDEPGTYGIVCNEYCGSGHHAMEGKIVVVPEDEFSPEG
ncbi:MAG: cytochrome c oxidase subunit II [Halodesulfurarchaeum sp.]